MSLIVSEIYDALIEAGSSPEKAKAAASAIPATEHLATKEDIAATKEDIAATKEELAKDIAKLDKKVAVLNVAVFSFGPAILALLVKLTFFP